MDSPTQGNPLSLNQVVISGRLTRDPEYKTTGTGRAMCRLGMALNRRWQDKASSEWKEETTFVNIVAWAATADWCKENLKKGSPCKVEGRLRSYEYEDKTTGAKRSGLEVQAFKVDPVEAPAKGSGAGKSSSKAPSAGAMKSWKGW